MPYLTDVKGFTNESVANDIFPVSVYASLVFYLVAGPVSRRIGLKTFVLLGATCKLWTRILLVWGTSLAAMQFTQVLFAAGSSADAILLAYAYAVARKDDGDAHPNSSTPTPDPNDPPSSARPGGRYRTVTAAITASHLGSYTLAALFGQIAYESGASYASLFHFSLGSVAAGCVVGCLLPSAPFDRGPGLLLYTARPTRTAYAPRPTRTLRDELRALAKATRDAFDATTSACYGSGVMIVLSAWWVLSSAPASFLEWYGTNLFDAIDGDADVNGYVVFVARLAMTAAAWAGGREWIGGRGGGRRDVASDPWFYAGTSVFVGVCAFAMSASRVVAVAAGFYCAALAASQGGAVVVYAQAALAMDALAASRERAKGSSGGSAEEEEGGGIDGDGSGGGSSAPASSPDHALLFGANGFLGVCALVLLQAFVDAARVGIRAEIAAAGWACLFAAAATVASAAARARLFGLGAWALEPTGADLGMGEALMPAAEEEDDEDVGAMAEADASGLLGRNT